MNTRPPRRVLLVVLIAAPLAMVGLILSTVLNFQVNPNRTLAFLALALAVGGFLLASATWLGWAWRSGAFQGASPEEDERLAASHYEDPRSNSS
jgi:hypothetical protein